MEEKESEEEEATATRGRAYKHTHTHTRESARALSTKIGLWSPSSARRGEKRDEARKTNVPEEKGSVVAYDVYIRNGRRQTAIIDGRYNIIIVILYVFAIR